MLSLDLSKITPFVSEEETTALSSLLTIAIISFIYINPFLKFR